ncbi:MAG TPA: hypothetical protein PKE29_00525 [Phycisphaerales bacterium]|nr:hypothetical protein [Phycisphaerales bacterium]
MNATEDEVVGFLKGRSAPCPRCSYELRDLDRAQCPECGEPLVLKVGSPNVHFGWLLLAAAPGCFCTVAAVLMLVPVVGTIVTSGTSRMPVPIVGAWVFGVLSSVSVLVLYRERHRFLRQSGRRQVLAALSVWGVHILAFVVMVGSMIFLARTPPPPPTPAATAAPGPAP